MQPRDVYNGRLFILPFSEDIHNHDFKHTPTNFALKHTEDFTKVLMVLYQFLKLRLSTTLVFSFLQTLLQTNACYSTKQ